MQTDKPLNSKLTYFCTDCQALQERNTKLEDATVRVLYNVWDSDSPKEYAKVDWNLIKELYPLVKMNDKKIEQALSTSIL